MVTSRDAVYNRSPLGMYTSVPIAAVVCAAIAFGVTMPGKSKGERRPRKPSARRGAWLRWLSRVTKKMQKRR